MLVSGDWVIVIGYSYARGGTEINRFRLSRDGQADLRRHPSLCARTIITARQLRLAADRQPADLLLAALPAHTTIRRPCPASALVRRRRDRSFRPIAGRRQIYVSPAMLANPDGVINTLHSVTSCDLTAPELSLHGDRRAGPASRTFYVSSNGVYLWLRRLDEERRGASRFNRYIFRCPSRASGPRRSARAAMPSTSSPSARTRPTACSTSSSGARLWRRDVAAGSAAGRRSR